MAAGAKANHLRGVVEIWPAIVIFFFQKREIYQHAFGRGLSSKRRHLYFVRSLTRHFFLDS